MSTKSATWGDIIKHRQKCEFENSEKDAMDKGEQESACDSADNSVHTFGEDDPSVNNSWKNNDWDNSAFSTPDFLNTGVGKTIVCQVLSSQAADQY